MGRCLPDGVHHLAEEELDDCCLVVEELGDRLEPCEQPVRLAQPVLIAKQMTARLERQLRQEPHQLELEQALEQKQEQEQEQEKEKE